MVTDDRTGLQFGSTIERNIFIDASQFKNRTVKVTARNTSGDPSYHLPQFTADLRDALARKGYVPTQSDSFGIRLDLNVLYSGHIQRNLGVEYGFLGGAAGGIAGHRSESRGGTAAGILVGSTLGSVIGSNITSDTYVVIAEVSIGIADFSRTMPNEKKVISFGSSPPLQQESRANFSPFREVLRTKIAVYAGGRNVSQSQVSAELRRRLVDIVGDSV